MDRLNDYRQIIRRIIGEYLEYIPAEKDVDTIGIIDEKGENFILLEVGWRYPKHVHRAFFHIRIKDDKIWIEEDWTHEGIATELIKAGVPPDMIVLGWQPPEMRPYVDLAGIVS